MCLRQSVEFAVRLERDPESLVCGGPRRAFTACTVPATSSGWRRSPACRIAALRLVAPSAAFERVCLEVGLAVAGALAAHFLTARLLAVALEVRLSCRRCPGDPALAVAIRLAHLVARRSLSAPVSFRNP